MISASTRATLLKLHRWVGLTVAALLLVQGTTGSLLVFREEIDRALHPELTLRATGEHRPVQPLIDLVRASAPQALLQRIKLPEDPAQAWMFFMRREDGAPHMVAVDPHRGAIVREGSYGTWPSEFLFRLHDALLGGRTGEIVVSINGIALVFLAVAGLIVWWPGRRRLKSGFRILTGQGADRTVRTSHRAVGGAVAIVLMMSGTTGALLIHRAVLQQHLPMTPRPKFVIPEQERELLPVDVLLEDARREHGPLPLRELRFSGAAGQVVALYFQDEASLRRNATRQYFYDAYEGRELGRYEPAAVPPLNTAYDWLYTIHTGRAGGWPGRMVIQCAGLALVFFSVSGVWLWFSARRQRLARRRQAQARAAQNPAAG
jgi:uncharacterized iron-regulated membrane protein